MYQKVRVVDGLNTWHDDNKSLELMEDTQNNGNLWIIKIELSGKFELCRWIFKLVNKRHGFLNR